MCVVLQSFALQNLLALGGNPFDQIQVRPTQCRRATARAMRTIIHIRYQDIASRRKCMFPTALTAFQRKWRWAYWHIAYGSLCVVCDGLHQIHQLSSVLIHPCCASLLAESTYAPTATVPTTAATKTIANAVKCCRGEELQFVNMFFPVRGRKGHHR